jgi:pimeloyl-ACP methyl ester carboxylesterase
LPVDLRHRIAMADIRTRTITANGLEFLVDEAGEGDRVALLLHGFPESRRCWRHQLPCLAELGWHAVAPDMRGYGGSSRPRGRRAYRIDNLVEDAAALFDALGAKQRLLIGHDWGGMIAWAFAIRRARPLDGMAILNAPHPLAYRKGVRHWRQRLRSWYVLFFQLPWLPERKLGADHAAGLARALERSARSPDTFPPEVMEQYRDNACQPGALTAMINYYRANRDIGAMARGPGVSAPTLLLWGEQDTALGPELITPSSRYVDDIAIERFPAMSHWLPEEAPGEVNAALAEWLRELSPRA